MLSRNSSVHHLAELTSGEDLMNAKKKKSKPSNINAEREALKADIRKKIKKPDDSKMQSQQISDNENEGETIVFDELQN